MKSDQLMTYNHDKNNPSSFECCTHTKKTLASKITSIDYNQCYSMTTQTRPPRRKLTNQSKN